MEEVPVFKSGTLQESSGTKKRMWKSLKQILTIERTLFKEEQNQENIVTCNYYNLAVLLYSLLI